MPVSYAWRPGSRISIDPQRAGRELESIRKQEGGELTQNSVVERARSANSALHEHFEWDDTKAAEQHRLSQAGELIRSIVIDVTRSNVEPPKHMRAFVNVTTEGRQHYTSTVHALSDAELRAQVVAKAWADLEAWRKRHAELVEFAKVFTAIDATREALSGS